MRPGSLATMVCLQLRHTSKPARPCIRLVGPGGKLRLTGFSSAFAARSDGEFIPNPLQRAVSDAAKTLGLIVVEGPMGSGKTEAALFAALQLNASGQQHGLYFALPTQVTSNRIHRRIEQFLRNTLIGRIHAPTPAEGCL
jgi:hypothetical protein